MTDLAPTREYTDDERKHLEFIQNVIDRLSGNSASLKRWTVLLAIGGYGLGRAQSGPSVVAATMVAVAALGLLDAAYLSHEQRFRRLYDEVVRRTVTVFMMAAPADRRGFAKSLLSWSVLPFYAVLIMTGLVTLYVKP